MFQTHDQNTNCLIARLARQQGHLQTADLLKLYVRALSE